MLIALAQLNYHIGNFDNNVCKIVQCIQDAKNSKADLIIFSELAVCGYPPRDFLHFEDFIEKCYNSINIIADKCVGIAAIIGSPSYNNDIKGKSLFNSAFFLTDGKVQSIYNKTLLPNYDVFDEYRYFEPNTVFSVVEYKSKKIAITICEDLWNIGKEQLYVANPMDNLLQFKPDLIVNIASSPFNYIQSDIRKEILTLNARKYNLPVFYVNNIGAQTELLFDGGSMVINSEGEIFYELKYFDEDFKIFDLSDIKQTVSKQIKQDEIQLINDALVMGVKDYFDKLNFKKAILGLSGGIDSAVTLVLAVNALGCNNVKAILMPSQFSSDHSINDSIELAKRLKLEYEIINIENVYNSYISSLNSQFKDLPFDITEENLQARIRAVILMALANKFSYILLNTSNKSEAAVGYGTLYGDMCGGLSVIGDLYKSQVYELASFINRNEDIIPVNIINKPPSAELRHNQKDTDSLPEYEILDAILFQYIEKSKSPRDIIALGFEKETVDRVLKLVNTNEYKRYQTPPILRVSPKSFGMGRRMPIVAKYLS